MSGSQTPITQQNEKGIPAVGMLDRVVHLLCKSIKYFNILKYDNEEVDGLGNGEVKPLFSAFLYYSHLFWGAGLCLVFIYFK